jgi:hypothetical protein
MNYKFIIIGFNCNGKMHVAKRLEEKGVRVGHIFRNTESVGEQYSLSTVVYDSKEVNDLFENQSYIFIKESQNKADKYYEGLSFYEYQNSDVIIMSPDQFNMVPRFDDNVIFVWLDNNDTNRRYRHRAEKRKYDFANQDRLEKEYIHDFMDRIGDNPIIYFLNENPERVATIVHSLIKHPDLTDEFLETFNN